MSKKRRKRIVLVDEDFMMHFHEHVLVQRGYEVVVCHNAKECLDFLKTRKQAAVFVVDVCLAVDEERTPLMRGETHNYLYAGLGIGRLIRKRRSSTPILFYTGMSHSERLKIIRDASKHIPRSMVLLKHDHVVEEKFVDLIDKIVGEGFDSVYQRSFLSKLKDAVVVQPNLYGVGIDIKKLRK